MSLKLVQGDTAPTLRGTITDCDTGDPVDLTGADIFFQMRKRDDTRYTINAAASIDNAMAGTVIYTLANNDLNTPGDYLGQFEVHYLDGKIQTTITPVEINVRRQ